MVSQVFVRMSVHGKAVPKQQSLSVEQEMPRLFLHCRSGARPKKRLQSPGSDQNSAATRAVQFIEWQTVKKPGKNHVEFTESQQSSKALATKRKCCTAAPFWYLADRWSRSAPGSAVPGSSTTAEVYSNLRNNQHVQ